MKKCNFIIYLLFIIATLGPALHSQTITNPRTPAEFEEVKGVVVRWDEKEYYQIFSNVQIQGWTTYWRDRYNGTMTTQATIVREALNEGIEVYVIDDTSHTGYYGTFLYSNYHVADTLIMLGVPSSPHLHIISYPAIDNSIWKVWIRDWGQYNIYKNGVDSLSVAGRSLDTTISSYLQKPFITTNIMDGGNFMVDGHGRLICDAFQTNVDRTLFGINDLVTVANYKIHVDYYMKLINEETFIVNEVPSSNHNPSIDTFFGDSTALEGAIATMKSKTSCFGRPYKFVRIKTAPTYSQNGVTYITSEAGYANALILNKTVLVPMYENPVTDTVAINTFKKVMPGYRIVGIQSKYYAARQGAIHCTTKELAADNPIFIAHAWLPDTTDNNQSSYQIKAYIKTPPGVNHAEVNWSIDPPSGFQSVPMTQAVGDTFVGYIPAQTNNNTLSYYISATANGGKQTVKPIVAPNGFYSTFLKQTSQIAIPILFGWTGVSTAPIFHWSTSIGATTYQFQVATDLAFTNIIYNYPALTDTFRAVSPVIPGTRYYSRVAARDSVGTTGWSNIISIDIDCPTPAATVLRDDFNRQNSSIAGTNLWSPILNHPSGGAITIVSNAMQATGANYSSSGVVWDTLMSGNSEASLKILQKSGNFTNSSLFIYARMNNKDYNTGTGYRLRYWEQSGADLIEIHRMSAGYGTATTLASTTREISSGDTITFRVLCDNKTMVALVNGAEVLRATDTVFVPTQWYFAFRSYAFPTPVRFDNFTITSQPPQGSSCTVTCPHDTTVSNDSGQLGAIVLYPSPTTTGSCGTVTSLPAAGSFFPIGTTVVTCLSTSGPGCTFTITVVDTHKLPLATPHLIGGSGPSTSPTIYWNSSPGATSYRAQIATDSVFTNIVYDYPAVVDTFQTTGQLTPATRYYSRVSAKDSTVTSGWSNIFSFDAVSGATTYSFSVKNGWNLVSLPIITEDSRTSIIFPTAVSASFSYQDNYIRKDTLAPGLGYWLKFSTNEIIQMTGTPIAAETLSVLAGWNLIGSISITIPVTSITTMPPGMTASNLFGFTDTYVIADSVKPSMGYWIKVAVDGKLILSSSEIPFPKNHLRIIPTSEPPPTPPLVKSAETTTIPTEYALAQNFPNPFNPSTSISFSIPKQSHVLLEVYTPLGQFVETLVDETKQPGHYTVTTDIGGKSSGMYFYKIIAGDFISIRKMMLMK